jgi:hypothetical protein
MLAFQINDFGINGFEIDNFMSCPWLACSGLLLLYFILVLYSTWRTRPFGPRIFEQQVLSREQAHTMGVGYHSSDTTEQEQLESKHRGGSVFLEVETSATLNLHPRK